MTANAQLASTVLDIGCSRTPAIGPVGANGVLQVHQPSSLFLPIASTAAGVHAARRWIFPTMFEERTYYDTPADGDLRCILTCTRALELEHNLYFLRPGEKPASKKMCMAP